MKVGEFFYALGIDVDDKKIDEFEKKIKDAKREVLVFGAAVAAAVYALDRFIDSSVRGAVALANFSLVTGESAQRLQQTQYAYGLANIALSADETTESIKGLQNAMTAIRLGGGNSAPFGFFGLDISGNKSPFDVIKDLQAKKDQYNPAVFASMAKQMGLSDNFVAAMQTVKQADIDAAQQLIRPQGVLDALGRIGKQIKLLKENSSLFKDTLVANLEPVWNRLIKGFYEFGRIITNIGGGINQLAQWFDHLSANTKKWLEIVAIGTAAALMPLRAQLLALLLIIEDISVYAQGGDSVIGKVIKDLEPAIKEMGDWVMKYVVQPIRDLIQDFKDTFGGKSPTIEDLQAEIAAENSTSPYTVPEAPNLTPEEIDMQHEVTEENDRLRAQDDKENSDKIATLPDRDAAPAKPAANAKPSIFDLYPYLDNPSTMAIAPGTLQLNDGKSAAEHNATFNNTFHIQGDNPQENARAVVDSLHNQTNRAASQLNNSKAF